MSFRSAGEREDVRGRKELLYVVTSAEKADLRLESLHLDHGGDVGEGGTVADKRGAIIGRDHRQGSDEGGEVLGKGESRHADDPGRSFGSRCREKRCRVDRVVDDDGPLRIAGSRLDPLLA